MNSNNNNNNGINNNNNNNNNKSKNNMFLRLLRTGFLRNIGSYGTFSRYSTHPQKCSPW